MMPLRPMAALLQRLVDKIDPHEGRYRMLFERSPLPMWVVDTQTLRFLAVNDAGLRLYEYSRSEFLAMTASRSAVARRFRFAISCAAKAVKCCMAYSGTQKTGEMIDIEGVGHLVAWRGRPRAWCRSTTSPSACARSRRSSVNRELELSHERLRALSRRLFEVQEERAASRATCTTTWGRRSRRSKSNSSRWRASGGASLRRARVSRNASIPCSTCSSVCVSSRSACARRSSTTSARRACALAHRPPGARRRVAGAFRNRGGAARAAARYRDRLLSRRPGHHERAAPCARAQRLVAALHRGGRLAISVRDDGRGFDLDSVRERAANGSSLGLVGMEERMALAGGSFELRSAPGQGTVLLATFPLPATAKERALG